MRAHSEAAWVIGFASCLVVASLAITAEARTCTTDAGCPLGFLCLGGSSAGSTCFSLSCKSNSDCGSGTVCDMNRGTECVQAADGGQSCSPASACVPQWQAPCTVDSDCGNGFQCISNGTLCDCSGRPLAGGVVTPCGAIPMPPHHSCVGDAACPSFPSICDAGSTCLCETTRACQENQMAPCLVSTDCLPGWTCMCPPAGGVNIPGDASLAAGSCPSMVCEPPNWDLSNLPTNGGANPGMATGLEVDAATSASSMTTSGKNTGATPTSSGGGCSVATVQAQEARRSGLWIGLAWLVGAIGIARRRVDWAGRA